MAKVKRTFYLTADKEMNESMIKELNVAPASTAERAIASALACVELDVEIDTTSGDIKVLNFKTVP